MQTFLPFPDFQKSARILDNRRLGKQRVETLQILRALTYPNAAWRNHPAVKMWRNHRHALALYGVTICREWRSRGFCDRTEAKIARFLPCPLNQKQHRHHCQISESQTQVRVEYYVRL